MTLPLSHYGVALQLALLGAGGLSPLMNLQGGSKDQRYFNLQADALRTTLFDFAPYKVYSAEDASLVWSEDLVPSGDFGQHIAESVGQAERRIAQYMEKEVRGKGPLYRENEIVTGASQDFDVVFQFERDESGEDWQVSGTRAAHERERAARDEFASDRHPSGT